MFAYRFFSVVLLGKISSNFVCFLGLQKKIEYFPMIFWTTCDRSLKI